MNWNARMNRMNIAVFCSSNELDEKYTNPAKKLAKRLAEDGHTMLYGGSEYGLMRIMADGMQERGAKIVSITIPAYSKYARKNADELVITKTLGERKATILERSDVIVMMVGGLGTLDEATEILELKKQDHHNKPVIILNTDGFYDGLKTQLERMHREGFLKMGEQVGVKAKTLEQFVQFVETADEVMKVIGEAYDGQSEMQVPSASKRIQLL